MTDVKEMENIDENSRLNAENDAAKIKFQQSSNGEAKVDMPDAGSTGYQCGLTKEELKKYATDPFWVFLRRLLLVLFWLLWVSMLAGAVVIIMMTPGCDKPKEPEWFEKSLLYELNVKTFNQQANKTHLGSVIEKLPYLKGISVSAIIIDDLVNLEQPGIIDPAYGSVNEFSSLAEGMRVILKINGRATKVDNEMQFINTLNSWLSWGAAGFLFDEVQVMGPEAFKLDSWKKLIKEKSTDDLPRALFLSGEASENFDKKHCDNKTILLNYGIKSLQKSFTASDLYNVLEHTVANDSQCIPSLVISSSSMQPLLNRLDGHERDRVIIFGLLARGVPYVYSGEENARKDDNMKELMNPMQAPSPMNWDSGIESVSASSNTFLTVFKNAAKLRYSERAIHMGNSTMKVLADGKVLAMSRIVPKSPGFVVATNFGDDSLIVDLQSLSPQIPDQGEIELVSFNSEHTKNSKKSMKEFKLERRETVVLQFVPKA